MKSTAALFLVLTACLLQVGTTSVVTCDDATRAVCNKFQGKGRVCGCESTTSYDCTQNYYSYHGHCKGQKFLNLCSDFCSKGGHICKGDVGGTCTEDA